MLRKIRIIAAILFFTFITLLFLDFTGTIHSWFGWMAKVQFFPALLALNVGVVLTLVVLTLLFGRIYCSVICPLGVMQDLISGVAGKFKRNRFSYSPAVSWLRYGILGIFIIAFLAGVGSIVTLLSPYSSYGRIASNLFSPIYQWGNNIFAYFAERADSYTFYSVDMWMKSLTTLGVVVLTFILIAVLAWRNGRTYCNTVCPVGTILGFLSKYSFFRPVMDVEKCNSCGLCARNCKAACIDSKGRTIDYSRCVTCMNCIEKCNRKAIKYQPRRRVEKVQPVVVEVPVEGGTSRRNFLLVSASFALASAVKAQERKVDGGYAIIEDKKIPDRSTAIAPPGALSARNLTRHCTACQLCITACPNQVLRPSGNLSTFMQPEMSYERGYCRPECTKCSEVCPTSAIQRIDTAEKSAIQIGHAVWIKENCLAYSEGVTCNNCFRHCPTGAIQMVKKDPDSADPLQIPVVNMERCIGCGACENLCPSRPFSAMYVEGHERHRVV